MNRVAQNDTERCQHGTPINKTCGNCEAGDRWTVASLKKRGHDPAPSAQPPSNIVQSAKVRHDLKSSCCGAPVLVCDDDICTKCHNPCARGAAPSAVEATPAQTNDDLVQIVEDAIKTLAQGGSDHNTLTDAQYEAIADKCAELSRYLDSISESFRIAASPECTALLAEILKGMESAPQRETKD